MYSIVFSLNTAIADSKIEPVQIYAGGMAICIKSGTLGAGYNAEVYTINGQKIIQKKLTGTFERIPVNGSAGLYIVKVEYAGGTMIKKILLQTSRKTIKIPHFFGHFSYW